MDQNTDVYDTFGQFVASELRQMSTENRITFKREIMQLILNCNRTFTPTPQAQMVPYTNNLSNMHTTTAAVHNTGYDVNYSNQNSYQTYNDQFNSQVYTQL